VTDDTAADGAGDSAARPEPDPRLDAEVTAEDVGAVLTTGDTTVIARTIARVVVPIILVTAVSLLFQGHNLPGGGFIGGVLTATAFGLLYVVYGLEDVRHLRGGPDEVDHDPATPGYYGGLFAVGLALAVASGLVPVVVDLPFLTQGVWFVELPVVGEFEVATAFAFDLGVYLVVVGALLAVLKEVGEE
jgi:multicomponent Na+:H+ antiporter subunit B